MESQVKLGRIFGVKVGLHASWFIIAILIACSLAAHFHWVNPDWSRTMVWTSALITALLFFASLVAHELAHALVAQWRKLEVHNITLFALGGVTRTEQEAATPRSEFLIAIAGPITSLCLGFVLLWIATLGGWAPGTNPASPALEILLWLGFINIALAIFNMIPGLPLDGGRVLRAAIWRATGDLTRATCTTAKAGQAVGYVLILYGIFRFFTSTSFFGGLWLAFIGWFLWQAAGATHAQLRAESLLRKLQCKDLMSHEYVPVDGQVSLRQFVDEQLSRPGERCYVVSEGGAATGIVTLREVRAVDRNRWATTQLHEAMQPLDQAAVITPETSALHAAAVMSREHVHQLPVISGGHVEGVISEDNIAQAVHSHPDLAEAS